MNLVTNIETITYCVIPIKGMKPSFIPIWFDSLGAKSSCVLIRTNSSSVLIDPGIAIMHRSFPAPPEIKRRWCKEGYQAIMRASRKAEVIVITHYHYDHFTDFEEMLYRGKVLLVKNPNLFINDSQRNRAMSFFSHLYEVYDIDLRDVLEEPEEVEPADPLLELPEANAKDFGDYNPRRRELLTMGRRWFERRVEKWNKYRRVPELKLPNVEVRFADGREFRFGAMTLRFTKPLFHGVEFSRVGWVLGLIVECGDWKLLYSSDLNGPIIEDYSSWIISEKPNVIILDGPMTYMFGYVLNRVNLRRAIDNAIRIVREAGAELILYDHHLPREPKFKERTKEVWKAAEAEGVRLMTVAEYLGLEPAVLRYVH